MNFSLGPDPAAMSLNDSLDDRESHARPFELSLTDQALEDAEKFIIILHVESNTIVFHITNLFPGLFEAAHFDAGILFPPRKLYRI